VGFGSWDAGFENARQVTEAYDSIDHSVSRLKNIGKIPGPG